MTAQIERNPREGVELDVAAEPQHSERWPWYERVAMVVCYVMLGALSWLIVVPNSGLVPACIAAGLGTGAAIAGHFIEEDRTYL